MIASYQNQPFFKEDFADLIAEIRLFFICIETNSLNLMVFNHCNVFPSLVLKRKQIINIASRISYTVYLGEYLQLQSKIVIITNDD